MKLAAIYNVWDGDEFLLQSMRSVKEGVDLFIIIYQNVSNFGEHYSPEENIHKICEEFKNVATQKYFPKQLGGFNNEINKRNLGLSLAKEFGCTHFLHMDCDEFYKDFSAAKQNFIDSGANGSVCKLFTYFRWPTLRFETEDGYYVPFIHKLDAETFAGANKYSFHVDPTRKINQENVILLPNFMHHFSWIRIDINRKIRNSSAKNNLARGTMLESYNDSRLGAGFYVKDYDKKLIEVEDFFALLPILS